ncbi:unnamed protein product [Rotaria sordida]|uniref:Nuclear receptor domain-containing protein n=1 Tax=Rotaria sordida TaxID=392033 RepID=A0A814H459_9BILA|nr:unnamed protein product [Rotaria sordida]
MERTTTIDDSTTSQILSTNVERQKNTISTECKICRSPARYSYYGVIVCHSCKMFFKRNAENRQAILKCYYDNQCNITMDNRHACTSCRLEKCFKMGMRIEMIRSSTFRKNQKRRKIKFIIDSNQSLPTMSMTVNKKHKPEYIPTLSLLESDQSPLNINQWNLLSNLVHCFDQHSGYAFVEHFLEEQNRLPIKLRYKYPSVCNFFTSVKSNIQLVFEKNRDFLSLSRHDRTTLLRTTVEYTTSIGGMFTLRQYKLFDYPPFYESTEMIFKPSGTKFARRVIDQLDPDNTFIKLILSILSFSTTNYTVYKKNMPINLTNIKGILSIQDMYTDLTWRYLLYKYGHHEAVIRFSNLLRCLFVIIWAIVEAHESQKFIEMIDSVIEQTKQTLCL